MLPIRKCPLGPGMVEMGWSISGSNYQSYLVADGGVIPPFDVDHDNLHVHSPFEMRDLDSWVLYHYDLLCHFRYVRQRTFQIHIHRTILQHRRLWLDQITNSISNGI